MIAARVPATTTRIRCAVQFEDDELFVSGGADESGALDFVIERPAGTPWMEISEPAHNVRGVNVRREIVALTFADDMVVSIAMSTGWFIRTGRTVKHPFNECNEVWSLSASCRDLLADAGLLREEAPVKAESTKAAGAAAEVSLYELLTQWMDKLRPFNVSCILVTVPNPFSETVGARLVVASYPDSLRKNAFEFEREDSSRPTKPLTQWGALEDLPDSRWAGFMLGLGYKSVIALRVPVACEQYIECLMFGTSRFLDDAQAALPICVALNALPQLKQATSTAVCNLTPRERACLLSAFQGKTANETAAELDCVTRTVRLHLSNAMNKLGSANTISAIQRALMLGII